MDEKMEKILTVVVPTYNAEKYLRDNLESFEIPEILQDIEILTINDGSTDLLFNPYIGMKVLIKD